MIKFNKFFVILLATLICMCLFAACSADLTAIDDYEWKMRSVMSNKNIGEVQNENELVIAVGEADRVHPNAKIVNLTLVAQNGVITVTDATNNKTYNGSYKVMSKTPQSIEYEIIIDGVKGYATVAPTKYYDGTEVPTLPINLGGYSLYFIPAE